MSLNNHETSTFSQDLKRYTGLLWHWTWLIILAVLLAGGAAYLISQQMTPIYQATATVLVEEPNSLNTSVYNNILSDERSIRTYTEMMVKAPILEGVNALLELNMEHKDLAKMVQAQLVRDTELIEVTVTDTDPNRAAAIANAVVSEFSRQIQDLQAVRYRDSKANLETQMAALQVELNQVAANLANQPEIAEKDRLEALQAQYREMYSFLLQGYEEIRMIESQSTSNVIAFEPAEAPINPIGPRVLQNTMLAAVVGGMLAVGLIFLIDALDDTLRQPEDFDSLGLPLLGMIARTDKKDDYLVTTSHPRDPISEAYRALRTNIQYASIDQPIKTLLITSPTPSEGKSTVVGNLATVSAQSECKVVIIDADLRKPKIHRFLKIPNRHGISDLFIQNQVHLDGNLQATKTPNLHVLPSGSLPPTPSELLGSEKMNQILELVKAQADLVIIDTPPVLVVTDACVLAPRVDGVLLVARVGQTKKTTLRETLKQLNHVNANVLGVVINDIKPKRSSYYYRNYYPYAESQ